MTALPQIAPLLRLPRISLRVRVQAQMALAALILAIPAALATTIVWWATQGGGALTLALVYTLAGNTTFLLVVAALACMDDREG